MVKQRDGGEDRAGDRIEHALGDFADHHRFLRSDGHVDALKELHHAEVKYTLAQVLADLKCADPDSFKSLKVAIRGGDRTVADALRRVLPAHVASALRSLCDRVNGKITLGSIKVHNVSIQLTEAGVQRALNGDEPLIIDSPRKDGQRVSFDAPTLRKLLGTDAFVAQDLPNLARAIVSRLQKQPGGASHACVVAVRTRAQAAGAV